MVPLKKRRFSLLVKLVWRVRISVSTQDFHSCKRGPTPLRATNIDYSSSSSDAPRGDDESKTRQGSCSNIRPIANINLSQERHKTKEKNGKPQVM